MNDNIYTTVRDPVRLTALHGLALLDTPPEPAFDRLTSLATTFLNAPIALVSLIDVNRQFFKSCVGVPAPWITTRETPLSHSFCQYVVASGEPFIVDDARTHPLVCTNLAIPDLGVIAYAGIPLVTGNGQVIGSFCVADTQPRRWTEIDLATLQSLTASAVTEIELRVELRERERLEQELRQAQETLEAQVTQRTEELVAANARLQNTLAEYQQAQGRLQLLDAALQHIDETIMITEATLDEPGPRTVYVNDAFTQMTGYEIAEIIGHTPRMLQGPKTDRAELDRFRRELSQQQHYQGEVINYRKDGSEYIMEWRVAAVRDTHGQVTHWVSNQRDVTEVRREQAAAVHRQQLESVGRLAAGITHDFNTFLMAILANAELAQLRLDAAAPAQKQLQEIEAIVQRATDLTRQVLAYAGKGQIEMQLLDLNTIVVETMELLQHTVAATIPLQVQFSPTLPPIQISSVQMRQLVMNLVKNACEAVAATDGTVTLMTGTQDVDHGYLATTYLAPNIPEGEYVYLRVSDTGPGMDMATQCRMFEPFYSTKHRGRGLGLATVLGVVHAHSGTIKVDSVLSRGTTFTVLLPTVETRRKAAPATQRNANSDMATD